MTTMPDHEHPQYVTHARLEALEGRIINRIAELELRLTREISGQWRWTVGLILPIYALVIGAIVAVAISAINILSRLPAG